MEVFECLGEDDNCSETVLEEIEFALVRKSIMYQSEHLRYDSFSQKYQAISGQVLSAFGGIDLSIFLLVEL